MTCLEGWLELVVESVDTYFCNAVNHGRHFLNLVLQCREVGAYAILKVADVVFPSDFYVETSVEHLTRVDDRLADTDFRQRSNLDEKVLGGLAVPVESEGQTVVEETSIDTEVNLL